MSRLININPGIVAAQKQAADPEQSVFVSANAGAGKTHVLTERVLRLLFKGAAPESLLCLTYTKAAASEMRLRVAERLGAWAVMDDAALTAALEAMTGARPDAADRARARTLFARALETPGGLKINTIHAFCESLLHRFPLEAGVPFEFSVIEDEQRVALLQQARDGVLAEGLEGDTALTDAVATLFTHFSDSQLRKSIDVALGQAPALDELCADPAGAKRRLHSFLQVAPGERVIDIDAAVLGQSLFPTHRYAEVFAICPGDPAKGNTFEGKLARVDVAAPDPELILSAFLKQNGEVPAHFPKSDFRKASAALADDLLAEAERLAELAARRKAVATAERSAALIDVVCAVATRYARRKRARQWLDFADLIVHTRNLLTRADAADWVRYKLDAGIAHILVDESQDTNAEQWRVIAALSDEFFAGEGAREGQRTLFVVGDAKQSIFSFQGAEPRLMARMEDYFGQLARTAGARFTGVDLKYSFRTQSTILEIVDRVAEAEGVRQGLLIPDDEPATHITALGTRGGSVTLWPLVSRADAAADAADSAALVSQPRQLADLIVRAIADMIANGRLVESRLRDGAPRPVTASDIMILVQERGVLFAEIIRALKQAGLPTPGADRLNVTGHLAVLDLLALGEVLANPADDLNLAAVLRSPLFDFSEAELETVCAERRQGESVFAALARHAPALPAAADARARLEAWRGRLDMERPYGFFADLLYAEGGLRRFHARMGPEVDDVIDAFLHLALEHEGAGTPGLIGFVAAMRQRASQIKRDLSEGGGGVRVMTVHAAKGLEAPIVFLADAHAVPHKRAQTSVSLGYAFPDSEGPTLVHWGNKAQLCAEAEDLANGRKAVEAEEYWRKLYVALTRAEDQLIVCGLAGKSGGAPDSWHAQVAAALAVDGAEIEIAGFAQQGRVYPPDAAPRFAPARADMDALAAAPLDLSPVAAPEDIAAVSPSLAFDAEPDVERLLDRAVERFEATGDADAARRDGLALHAMLQHLTQIPLADRAAVAAKAVGMLRPDAPERHAALCSDALAILHDPALAPVFGPQSRAEVPFAARARREDKPIVLQGRMDRVVRLTDRIMVIDFKSDRIVPQSATAIPPAYMLQLGLYRLVAQKLFASLPVEAHILWTASRTLMRLEDGQMDAATKRFTLV